MSDNPDQIRVRCVSITDPLQMRLLGVIPDAEHMGTYLLASDVVTWLADWDEALAERLQMALFERSLEDLD